MSEGLRDVWRAIRHRPAWLSLLVEAAGLSLDEEGYLSDLDEAYTLSMRELEAVWREDARTHSEGLRQEIEREAPAWCRDRRKECLETEAQAVAQRLEAERAEFLDLARRGDADAVAWLVLGSMESLERRLSRIKAEIWYMGRPKGKTSRLTDAQIERAKSYPLEALLDEQPIKGRIRCPLHLERVGHEDRDPSMVVKNGWGYCFSCGGSLDAIGYLMKVRGLSFPEAVEALQA